MSPEDKAKLSALRASAEVLARKERETRDSANALYFQAKGYERDLRGVQEQIAGILGVAVLPKRAAMTELQSKVFRCPRCAGPIELTG